MNLSQLNKSIVLSCVLGVSSFTLTTFPSVAGQILADKTVQQITHPNLVNTFSDVEAMRSQLNVEGRFKATFEATKSALDIAILEPINVPFPKDAGGGYTHEVHKNNYKLMYDAGIIYQLTKQQKYADFVRDVLVKYAELYPKLSLHPERKSSNPGKLFWQGLNEAVWLVHTIQAYDAVLPALSAEDRQVIEQGALRPVALFLSEESPNTFNKVHNHGTWATCAVGMTGFVLGEDEWVEKSLYGLDKTGTGGFMRQLDELFSPEGYYNEGPYYQRYALMPFVTFAKAIENNQPERKIFEHRGQVLLKAIEATAQLSYAGLFFPINDAIKDKGIDTIELVHGVAIAYGVTKKAGLLGLAQQQNQIILTGDGLKVAKALDANLAQPYQFKTQLFGDGATGKDGAFAVLRTGSESDSSVVTFKATAQGLGHGHFDKLNLSFYDKGREILSDYGAARFLNVEAKFGGRYLPENETYAKQTVAHNTVVVDEISHFDADTDTGNMNHPEVTFFAESDKATIVSAEISTAYKGVKLARTIALIKDGDSDLILDIFDVESKSEHQYDLPFHYEGHFIQANFKYQPELESLTALGQANGYQHLWLKAQAQPKEGLAKLTWLNDNGRFYTLNTLNEEGGEVLFVTTGANDPDFNLRHDNAFILRVDGKRKHQFVSVIEAHGEYNPSKEYTLDSESLITSIEQQKQGSVNLVIIKRARAEDMILAYQTGSAITQSFVIDGQEYTLTKNIELF
ncbi:alginate lyase family protein [Catenovulum maritimum]|uniref:alginate lyase family protein n=1 Tax=Catenovulum maritimum TaxID=1513271 RepID=UPI00069F0256|nr:alginate lyase family protein [Catenovulum maritimum]